MDSDILKNTLETVREKFNETEREFKQKKSKFDYWKARKESLEHRISLLNQGQLEFKEGDKNNG